MNEYTLLVVDDIEMNREMMRKIFEQKFDVLQAANGADAMQIIASTPVDIVIVDIFMEPMNGYELIQNIRAKEEYKKIPIIAVTESDHASRKKALKAGADDLIYKPYISSILHNRVNGLMYDGYDLDRYRQAYENNPIPFAVYHVIDRPDTPNYKIVYMNRAAKKTYSPPYIENTLQTDEKPEIRNLLLRAIRSGDTQRNALFEPSLRKWLDWTVYLDGKGLVAAMIHDITGEIERQTEIANTIAKTALAERNNISQIVENIPGGIFVFRVSKDDVSIVDANTVACRLLGVDPSQARQVHKDTILSFVHPEDYQTVVDAMKKVLTPGHTVSYKCRILNRSKNDFVWFYIQSHGVPQADGSVFAYTSYTDISSEIELEHTRTELLVAQRSNQAKTDFLSRVSHDMRTPLNGIIGLTALLKEKITDESTLHDVGQLQMSGQYLLNLVTDTLDVSKIENGKLELHPQVCEGRAVFNALLNLSKPNMEAKHLRFTVDAENLPFTYLYLDVGRVEQIVMNILSNAVKFTPEGGSITFTVKNLSATETLITDVMTIEDNGVGMSKEFLPTLFEPFSQENNGITSTISGTGLGMSITKQLVELMGGSIEVESESGKGTKVTVTLPMPVATEQQIREWQDQRDIVYNGDSLREKRILLCEDHPLNANIATRLLTKKGVLVEHAVNGEIGVAMFGDSPEGYYDAILMDIRMPVMDGITATRAIRALPRGDAANIPIIAMTANAFPEDIENTRAAGMNEHLSKPIDTNKLYETLEKQLRVNRYLKRKKILIVDDLELNREVLKTALRDEYAILEATNGNEALEMLEKVNGIDAVITDLQMPVMDGIELIKRIRAAPQYCRIAILANTQYGDPKQEEELLSLGADDFIYKPTTPMVVKSRMRSALKK